MRGLLSALVLVLLVSGVRGEDWPQWGGHNDRNMVGQGQEPPRLFCARQEVLGGHEDRPEDLAERPLGRPGWARRPTPARRSPAAGSSSAPTTSTSTIPVPSTGGGQVLCLDAASGKLLWRLVVPKLESKQKTAIRRHGTGRLLLAHRRRRSGLPGRPTAARSLCLDVHGQTDADIIWRYDMIQRSQGLAARRLQLLGAGARRTASTSARPTAWTGARPRALARWPPA